MMADPQQIRVLAARLHTDAERLRGLATRVGRTSDVAWRSRAAMLFRERVVEHAHALHRSAGELDEASRRVDTQAEAVEGARAELARGAAIGAGLARTARGAATRATGS